MTEFNNYFEGQYLSSVDLNFDNVSHRDELAKRFNLLLDTPGVVQGYNDSLKIIPGSVSNSITLLSGAALDVNGRLIEVLDSDPNRINILFDNIAGQTYYVKAKYKELLLEPQYDPITGIGPDPNNPEIPYFTKIQDYYDIEISTLVPDMDQVEIGRVIGSGTGNLLTNILIDLNQRKLASVKNDLLRNIDHTTLKNIGSLTHSRIDQLLAQLLADTGIIPTVDGSPSLDIPLSDLITGFYNHDHSGDGHGARIDHNSLKNIHPDQHHKKIHIHSMDPGQANSDTDDAYVTKINLSDDSNDPIEVRGKLSSDFIKEDTIIDANINSSADINQNKIAKSGIVEDNFTGTPINLQQELNQLRSELKFAKFGHDPLKSFDENQTPNIKELDTTLTSSLNGTTGHHHTGVDGDGPKLNDNSIAPASLTKQSIALKTIDDSLISDTAAIKESKLDLESSYTWRNHVISGAALSSFNGGSFNLIQPLVIYNSCCDRQVNVITNTPLALNDGDVIYVEWPESHDDNLPLSVQSSGGNQISISASTVVLGYVNENDHRLYVNWAHNPYHRHTGAPGDYERLDINDSTSGDLPASRLSGMISPSQMPNNINASSIANGSVNNTEFQYLDGLTNPIQSQLDNKVSKTGDTMSGDLTFLNNDKLTFQNSNNQPISFYRPNASPTTKAKLHLSLGDSSSTLNEFHVGRGNFTSGKIILGLDPTTGKGKVTIDGDESLTGRLEANELQTDSGVVYGSNKRMLGISNTQVILNPFNDFTDGTKVTNNLIIQGITPDTGLLQIEDQIIEKDQNYGGISFSTQVGNVQNPALLYSKDIYLTNLNEFVSAAITQLQQQAKLFKKDNFTYGSPGFNASNTVQLSFTPVADSTHVHTKISGVVTPIFEGIDYTISGNNLVLSPSIIFSAGDMVFVQYSHSL